MSTVPDETPVREERPYKVLSRDSDGGLGKTTVDLRCPYCQARVTAYVWSMAGHGKRCPCGAKFTSFGVSIAPPPAKRKPKETPA